MPPISENNPLGEKPVGRLLIQYAIPSIISTLLSSLYNIIDQIFIGQRIGYLGNAATTVAYPLTILCGALTLLMATGASVLFNILNGKGKKSEAMDYAGTGIAVLIIEGIIVGLLVSIFTPFFVYVFGATVDVTPYAITYMRIIGIGIPFMMLTTGGTLLVRSDGSPRYALACSLAGVGCNIVLDYLFLFPLDMGIAGAALATIIGQILSAAMVIWYLLHFKTHPFTKENFAISFASLKQIAAIGAAASLNQAAMLVMNMVLNSSLRYYGDHSVYGGSQALAAAGVVTKTSFLFYATMVGCSIGGQPIMGFNFGAVKYDRVKKTYRLILTYAVIAGVIETACFWLLPRQMISIFGESSGSYESFALRYMHVFMLLVILSGIPPVSMNLMSSIGKAKGGIIISLSKQLALILLLLLLPRIFGIDGVLYAGPLADISAAICSWIMVSRIFKTVLST